MLVKPKYIWEMADFFNFRKFGYIFSCLFTIFQINCHISNTFWLYQHGVKNAPWQSYSHFFWEIVIGLFTGCPNSILTTQCCNQSYIYFFRCLALKYKPFYLFTAKLLRQKAMDTPINKVCWEVKYRLTFFFFIINSQLHQ